MFTVAKFQELVPFSVCVFSVVKLAMSQLALCDKKQCKPNNNTLCCPNSSFCVGDCNLEGYDLDIRIVCSDVSDGDYGFFSLPLQEKKPRESVPKNLEKNKESEFVIHGQNIYDYAQSAVGTAKRVKLKHAAKEHLLHCQERLKYLKKDTLIGKDGKKVEVICID